MNKVMLERKIEQHRKNIDVLERELREINNKPHVGIEFNCSQCDSRVSYLSDEIVSIGGEMVCWDCFDSHKGR